jgi:hypothetical protein
LFHRPYWGGPAAQTVDRRLEAVGRRAPVLRDRRAALEILPVRDEIEK